MSALETSGLSKAFGERMIFEEVALRLERGEATALVGPSGAGKTTLLRCLNGLELADRGSVIVDQIRLNATDAPEPKHVAIRALRQRVGFVFQGCHLFSHRTVLENVLEGPLYVRRQTREQAGMLAAALLERVGVAHRQHAYPRQLSLGEQQRAAIARALAMSPEVLLLDEPTSALDPERSAQLAELLRALIADGLAVLAVTHDAGFAVALGARVLKLEGTRVVESPT